ncbi:hypothetical protein [Paraburkholderia lacunae]|nr:hypothetical protein [Paraburkholderia lacunae]
MKKLVKFFASEQGFDRMCWWAGRVFFTCAVFMTVAVVITLQNK